MKVTVNGYYPGQLTREDFFNVTDWRTDKDESNLVDITFQDVSRIEKIGEGVRIIFEEWEEHYFDKSDYLTISIM